jgi:hypothetical protein
MSEAIGGPMGLLALPRERVLSQAREGHQRQSVVTCLLAVGGFGSLVSEIMYAMLAWTQWSGLSEPTRYDGILGWWAVALGAIHVMCWVQALRAVTGRRRGPADTAVALGIIWFVCGGWVSVLSAYLFTTDGLVSPKVVPQAIDVLFAAIALIPLLSVMATCVAAVVTRRPGAMERQQSGLAG